MTALAMNLRFGEGRPSPEGAGEKRQHEERPQEARPAPQRAARAHYLVAVTWAFTLFNSVRVFSYLPTLWAIHASGDSSQHSLITWGTWFGANVTMALWLYETSGQRMNRAVGVNLGNAAMCAMTLALIAWHRF